MTTIIWKGHASQWVNSTFYIVCIPLTAVFGLGVLLAFWKYYETVCHTVEINDERIIEYKGIFSKEIQELELYRVKDLKIRQPFIFRLVGLSNIILYTTDHTDPIWILRGIENGESIKEALRAAIDQRRDAKKIQELDINNL